MRAATARPAATTLPDVVARFPEWQSLHTTGRYLTIVALNAGLGVSHDGTNWRWHGHINQFKASGIWSKYQNWSFVRCRWTYSGEGLRATLVRQDADPQYLVAIHKEFFPLSKDSRAYQPSLLRAAGDCGYHAFRAALLQPIPSAELAAKREDH